ncbi:hypothetical protein ACS8YF_12605 [Salinisphaera sp. SWV1]|uniref:hypothetical protein n=1 Tax=Salinisphaera sp. SWV1 TaxID=3454139 RepID=UPI003F85694D
MDQLNAGLNDPRNAGLMGMAEGLMAAGGAHRLPVSMGQALAMGLQNAQQNQQQVAHTHAMQAHNQAFHQEQQQRLAQQQAINWLANHPQANQQQMMPHLAEAAPHQVATGMANQQFPHLQAVNTGDQVQMVNPYTGQAQNSLHKGVSPSVSAQTGYDWANLKENTRHHKADETIASRNDGLQTGTPTLSDAALAYHRAYPYGDVPFNHFLQQNYPSLAKSAPQAQQPSNNSHWYSGVENWLWGPPNKPNAARAKSSAKPASPTSTKNTPSYSSADEVKQAYHNGKLTRAQATQLLTNQFGYHE